MSGKAPLLAQRKHFLPKVIANGCNDWCTCYEGKFESTQINLSLTGTAPLGGDRGLKASYHFFLLIF